MAPAAARFAWRALVACASLLVMATPPTRAANILAILATPTKSHHIWNSPLMEELAARGHNLTVLSPTAMKPPRPNVTDLVIEGVLEFVASSNDYMELHRLSTLGIIEGTFEWYLAACNYSQNSKGVRQLYEYPDDFRFDLIIIEATGGECLLGFVEKFGRPPLVALNAFGNPQWINWNVGNPDNPAYVANAYHPLSWPFSLAQRLTNVALYAATLYHYHWNYLPRNDEMLAKHFAGLEGAARVEETLRNASVVLVSAHHSLDGGRPFVPALVPVAGMHIRPARPLPEELERWVGGARGGAVLLSLGTIVHSERLGARQLAAMVAALAGLPAGVRVLWKWEGAAPPPGLPAHVRTFAWLPQADVLAHPNVRLFVSHAGMLSTHEAVWRGVPVVAIPFVVDQHLNAHRLVALGVAERLDYLSLTTEDFLAAMLKVLLLDAGYRQRMQKLSSTFRSRPMTPLDTAVYWVEHVLQHSSAPHMRSPTIDLPWYELWLLDVAAVVAGALALMLIVTCCACAALRNSITKAKKKSE